MKIIDTDIAIDHFHGDALIAATASFFNAELVTRNIKHYPMSDIKVVVPYERGRN